MVTIARALAILFVLSLPASAAEVTITLSDQEQAAMIQLLDTAVKSGGLNNAEAVVYFVKKIQAAQQAAVAAQQQERR